MSDVENYMNLPEDPELAFVEFEKTQRESLWKDLQNNESSYFAEDCKRHYVSRVMGFCKAHGFTFLDDPLIVRNSDDFVVRFDNFSDKITEITTEISIRHARRLRPIHVVVSLTEDMKRQIHSYISSIRNIVNETDIPEAKKEAIFAKINTLADEIDRDRTKAEAWTAFVLEIATTTGTAAKELEPVRKLSDSIGNLLGKAKELGERLGLPAPRPTKRIENMRQRVLSGDADNLDDEIPF